MSDDTFAIRSEGFGNEINWSYLFFDKKGGVYVHKEAKGWNKKQAVWRKE